MRKLTSTEFIEKQDVLEILCEKYERLCNVTFDFYWTSCEDRYHSTLMHDFYRRRFTKNEPSIVKDGLAIFNMPYKYMKCRGDRVIKKMMNEVKFYIQ